MLIKKMKLADLRPADYNPRKDLKPGDPEYESLLESIKHFGYVEPIVYNKRSGRVVGGHQRIKVMADLGITEEKVVIVDLDDMDEKTLNTALNRISGDWDDVKLAELLKELSADEEKLALTGFSADEIDNLINSDEMQFMDFDGDGDGGGSYVGDGKGIHIVIGAFVYTMPDKERKYYEKTKLLNEDEVANCIRGLLSK